MKKLVLLSALFALAAALVFTACKKDETPAAAAPWANAANPFDHFGQQHNDGLDLLEKLRAHDGPDLDGDFRILAEHGYEMPDRRAFEADFALVVASRDPLRTACQKLRQEGRMSDKLLSTMEKLDALLASSGLTGQFAADVKALEATVPTLGLTEKEAETFYMATSIARFSNQHWMQEGSEAASLRMKKWLRALLVIGADVAGGILSENVGIGIECSILVKDLTQGIVTSDGGGDDDEGEPTDDEGGIFAKKWKSWQWHWGMVIWPELGLPCAPGFAIPCGILPNPGPNGPYDMSGPGVALASDVVTLVMDGSALDPDFLKSLDSGVWEQGGDFTVPREVVEEIMEQGGFDAPTYETVFTAGSKQVINIGDQHLIIIPVAYPDGTTATWLISISE